MPASTNSSLSNGVPQTAEKHFFLKSLSSLTIHANEFRTESLAEKATRYEIREAALKLADAFEDPVEQALRIVFETSPPVVALRIALEGDFLEVLKNGDSWSADELALKTGCGSSLIVRVMRILAASRMAEEVGVDTYSANGLTLAFLQPGIGDAIKHSCDIKNMIFAKLPSFLSNTGFQEPDNYTMGPHTFIFGKPLWKHLELEPQQSRIFDRFMKAFKQNRESWVDVFDHDDNESQLTKEDVLAIDIAGGLGHRLIEFKAKYPDSVGRLVLQDQAHVLPAHGTNPAAFKALENHGIELMEHDIFLPQLIIGAKYYFFSAIFHGRPDSDVVKLLSNTASAMRKGFSKILINDFVIPEQGVGLSQASYDLWMMAEVTGKERTLSNWTSLFDQTGLELVKVHKLGIDTVIEIELK